MIAVWMVLGLPLVVLLSGVMSYNRFVSQRTLIHSSWANIDTELRRRYDLIPNLVETVKGYAAHERQVLAEVTACRTRAMASTGPPPEQEAAEEPLVNALRHLFAVVESYPELKADTAFAELRKELVDTEDRLQAARRFYNLNVQAYNTRVQSVPSSLIAGMFGFAAQDYFTVEPALRDG